MNVFSGSARELYAREQLGGRLKQKGRVLSVSFVPIGRAAVLLCKERFSVSHEKAPGLVLTLYWWCF